MRAFAPRWETKQLARKFSLLDGVARVRLLPPHRRLLLDGETLRPARGTCLLVEYEDGTTKTYPLAEAKRIVERASGPCSVVHPALGRCVESGPHGSADRPHHYEEARS